MRIVSLYPAGTEIIYALGRQDDLVGVSSDCQYPAAALDKPRVSSWKLTDDTDSAEVDRWTSERAARGEPSFNHDRDLLASLHPDMIVTQGLCAACAPTPDSIQAVINTLPGPPTILNLNAATLGGVLDDIRHIGEVLDEKARAAQLVNNLQQRAAAIEQAVVGAARPRVAMIEWLDPVYCMARWAPEMLITAGGTPVVGEIGGPSVRLQWDDLEELRADTLLLCSCGHDVERVAADWERALQRPQVQALEAVLNQRVFMVDGNRFCQAGPRLFDSMATLAALLHPERFNEARLDLNGWRVPSQEAA